jgi:predicted RNA-binding Zn ribbon-like protein
MIRTQQDYRKAGFGSQFAWLDFVNSQERDGFGRITDHLRNPLWLANFLRHFHLADTPPPSVPLKALTDLREFLRGVAETFAAGHTLSAADLRTLNATLRVLARQKLFQRQNGFRAELLPLRSGWPWILSRIAASLANTLTDYDRDRVKICANDGCRWAYYDVTKGNMRRWCSDRTCGNRDRVRRARARAATKRRRTIGYNPHERLSS